MTDINIILKKSELIYEVENNSHLISRGLFDKGQQSQAFHSQATSEDENKLLRAMQTAVSILLTSLSQYVKHITNTSSNNILIDNSTDITITLSLSSSINNTASQQLSNLCHQYVVNYMLFDWLSSTLPESCKIYKDLADEDLSLMKYCFIKQPPVRPAISQ